jgi:hypothetical protein
MSKVLQRSMFQKPQHEHRSTGIASGLKYREEYAVGGRVGYRNGELVVGGNSFTDAINKANLELIQSLQAEPVPQFDPIDLKTGLPSLGPLVGPDVVYPLSGGMATMRLNDAMAASSPENQPTTYDLMTPRVQRGIQAAPKGMTEAEAKKFTSDMGLKEEPKPDPDPAPGNQEKRIGNILDQLDSVDNRAKLKRESLNEELAALRSKQDKDNRLLAALNVVSAMNDPNLPQGASRIAAGAQQLGQEGALAIQTKQQRDDIDLARKFDIAEQEINREYALEDFRAQKQIEAEYGTEGVLVQNIRFFMKELGIDPGTPEARNLIESFISDNKKGSIDTLTNNVFEIANLDTTFPDQFRIKYGLPAKENLEDGSEAPLTFDEIKQAITNINDQILQAGLKDGGRVGFALGGEVTSNPNKNSVPIVMGYDQLKETLGEIVPDNVIKLISANPTAFKEFAAIETNQDVSDFNDKYEVRFTLPEPAMVREQQGDFATSITPPVTAPSAVAANPQIMPMQTGAGQLTPTETAFLSPTEQAIKMRS